MPIARLWRLLGSAATKISGVHPLLYLAVYLLLVPIFAAIYCQLPNSFYAPYARLEYSGRVDQHKIGEVILDAIQRCAKNTRNTREDKWEILPLRIYLQQLHATPEGAIDFNLLVMAKSKSAKKGLFQYTVAMTLKHGQSLILQNIDNKTIIYHVFEIQESGWPRDYIDSNKELFSQMQKIFGKVEFVPEEDSALSRFFDGMMGDALSFSGTFPRMLYFSAVVVTTVGFGDIVPISGAARFLVAFEALLGIVIIGLFLNSIAYMAAHRDTTYGMQ